MTIYGSDPAQNLYAQGQQDQQNAVRNAEVAGAVWAGWQLHKMRQAQEEQVDLQKQMLRQQRAQNMLLLGWTPEQITAQFDAEDKAEWDSQSGARLAEGLVMWIFVIPFALLFLGCCVYGIVSQIING